MFFGCARSDPRQQPTVVSRSDSASVSVVSSAGGDRSQDFPPVGRDFLRDSTGERWLFSVKTPQWLRVAPSGRIYAISWEHRAIAEFDSAGRFRRMIGRRGRGPGEMEMPLTVMLRADTLAVNEGWNRSILRWVGFGDRLIDQLTPGPGSPPTGPALAIEGSSLLSSHDADPTDAGQRIEIQFGWSADVAPMAVAVGPKLLEVETARCGVQHTFPLFVAIPSAAAEGEWSAFAVGSRYEVREFQRHRLTHVIRRAVPDRIPTEADIERYVGHGRKRSDGGSGQCTISPEELRKGVPVGQTIPPVHGIAVMSDGALWVRRTMPTDDESMVDEFDASGAYTRTWRGGSIPLGRLSDGRYALVREDAESGGFFVELVTLPPLQR
jgi:hypothetical protein